MWNIVVLTFIWMGLAPSLVESDVTDFENTVQEYDIIYHHGYHLLLAMHEDKCYFVDTPENKESTLDDDSTLLVSRLQATEFSLLRHIQRNSSGEVRASTLEAVREKFHDLLADFHCLNKHVFEVNFYNAGSQSQDHTPSCEGKSIGMHEDPRDCHRFINCDGLHTFYETCAPGAAFSKHTHRCEHESTVTACEE